MDRIVSGNGRFSMILQDDGNLVLYDRETPYWATHTVRPLEVTPPGPAPTPPRPSAVDKRLVRCNFCNLHDSTGRPIFSSSLPAQPPAMQQEWIQREIDAGGTHYQMSVETGYHTMYGDLINHFTDHKMPQWLEALDRVLAAGLVPLVMLDSGDPPYPGTDYMRRLVQAIPATYYARCVWVCGWECVMGQWTSAQYNRANLALREALGPEALLACHLSPGRAAFSSNPIEADDPWQGGEMDCWHAECGKEFDIFLYQSVVPRMGDAFDIHKADSWGERAKEVADRFLGKPGVPDWFSRTRQRGRPALIWFEATAYSFIRGESTTEWAREVARYAQGLGYQGFGNGLP